MEQEADHLQAPQLSSTSPLACSSTATAAALTNTVAVGLQPSLYQNLEPTRNEIRILQVHPSDDLKSIPECHMEIASLDKSPCYLALSYDWGDPKGEEIRSWEGQDAIINGERVKITKNLFAALLYIRLLISSVKNSYFWIDAVCINQNDFSERSQQVGLMGRIYSTADKVLLWLGVDRNNSTLAVEFIKEASTICRKEDKDILTRWYIEKLNDRGYFNHWLAFGGILHRSFWRRSWIIQEIVLARTPILICGNDIVGLSALLDCLADLLGLARSSGWFNTPQILHKILILSLDLHRIRECRENYQKNVESKRGLLCLLENLGWTLASDPRDKAYSLSGIAKPYNGVQLPINYHHSAAEVFTDTAMYIILNTRNLGIITKASSRNPHLPSWVPDWADQDWRDPLIAGTNRAILESVNRSDHFSAGGSHYTFLDFLANKAVFTTDAILVSTVDELYLTRSYPWSNSSEVGGSFLETVTELINLIGFLCSGYRHIVQRQMQSPGPEEEPRECLNQDRAERTLQPDSLRFLAAYSAAVEVVLFYLYKSLFCSSAYFATLVATWPYQDFAKFCKGCLVQTATASDCSPHQLSLLWTGLSNAGIGRKFFKCRLPEEFDQTRMFKDACGPNNLVAARTDLDAITSKELPRQTFGPARGDFEIGDSIAVIRGCKSPMIVRAMMVEQGKKDCYRLIGEAYCDQLMDFSRLPKLPISRISLI